MPQFLKELCTNMNISFIKQVMHLIEAGFSLLTIVIVLEYLKKYITSSGSYIVQKALRLRES